MVDIAPALAEKIEKAYKSYIGSDKRLKAVEKKIENKTAGWIDAHNYAVAIADDLKRAFALIKGDDLPDGKMYWNIAERVVRPLLEDMEERTADVSRRIQDIQNEKAGIGLKSV